MNEPLNNLTNADVCDGNISSQSHRFIWKRGPFAIFLCEGEFNNAPADLGNIYCLLWRSVVYTKAWMALYRLLNTSCTFAVWETSGRSGRLLSDRVAFNSKKLHIFPTENEIALPLSIKRRALIIIRLSQKQ